MTVAELIAELETLPGNLEIGIKLTEQLSYDDAVVAICWWPQLIQTDNTLWITDGQ
jgi:hypothetical protein